MADNAKNFTAQCGRVFDRITKTYPDAHLMMVGIAKNEEDNHDAKILMSADSDMLAYALLVAMRYDEKIRDIVSKAYLVFNNKV